MHRFVSNLTRDTLAVILAGGRGSRLRGMTEWRAKPAVPIAGMLRIVDFPLSNCVNSGIRRIQVLTQYKAHSLIRHVQHAWGFLRSDFGEFVDIVPAQQRIETDWYAGTADAVFQNLDIIQRHAPRYVLVLAGDHVYKMDYGEMLATHAAANADVTVGCIEVPVEDATRFGVLTLNEHGWITRFDEKPPNPTPIPGRSDTALASMGIYVFSTDYLIRGLEADAEIEQSSRDFGKDVLPRAVERGKVMSHRFVTPNGRPAYWRDVGTVDAYWQTNLELVDVTPPLDLYDPDWRIWSHMEQLPPAKFVFDDDGRRGFAVDSMVGAGSVVSGATVRRSMLFSNVRVNSYATVEDSVVLPNVDIGRDCRIKKAVIDKRCRIPAGTVIGEDPEADAARFYRSRNGVVLVLPKDFDEQNAG